MQAEETKEVGALDKVKARLAALGVEDAELMALLDALSGEEAMEMPAEEDRIKAGFTKEAKRYMPDFKLEE